jgi:Na+/glutamate symporter
MSRTNRRTITIALVAALALAGGHGAAQAYEVWALDQGTNTIYIITPDL